MFLLKIVLFFIPASDGEIPFSPLLGMIVGAASTLICIVFLVIVKVRRNREHVQRVEKPAGPACDTVADIASREIPPGKETTTLVSREGDEKDPDIIPAKYGKYKVMFTFPYFAECMFHERTPAQCLRTSMTRTTEHDRQS